MRGPYRKVRMTPTITATASASHGSRRVAFVRGGSGGADREFTARKLSYDSKLMLRGAHGCPAYRRRHMARYQDDSDSGRTLLIAAGVTAGLLAGALLAHRYGGWRGMRRRLSRSRRPLLAALRAAIPSRTLAALLEVINVDEILAGLLGDTRRSRRVRGRRRADPDLDEYEVEEFERAAAGLDDDDEDEEEEEDDEDAVDTFEAFDGFDDEEDDDDPDSPIARLRRFRHASAHDLEHEDLDDDEDGEAEGDEDEEDDEADDAVAFSPAAVEEAVLAAFQRHPILRERALQISVDEDGVVELTGWVRRERDIRTGRRVAAAVAGVERVVVDVAVRDGVGARADAHVTEA